MSEFVEFLDEEPGLPPSSSKHPWIIGVVDDEPAVFEATRIALEGTVFQDRPLSIVYAASAAEGEALVRRHPDMACILLDVVMETEHAGFDLVRDIRETLGNQALRIILRTGQPGYAPPMEVIRHYDINDYKEKSELTQTRLFTAVVCALRSYQQILALEANRKGLRLIIEASSELMRRHGIADFARGVVTQLTAHLGIEADCLICVSQQGEAGHCMVIGAAGKFSLLINQPLAAVADHQAVQTIEQALATRSEVTGQDDMALFINGDEWKGVIYIKGRNHISALDRDLLRLYCTNVSLGFENVRLFEAVSQAAYVERITKLPTRSRLEQVIDQLMGERRDFGVLVVEIDRFAEFSTLLGSQFAENLLRAMAARLADIQPKADFVGSLWGAAFAVILDAPLEPEQLLRNLETPISVGGRALWVRTSCGFAALPGEESVTAADLIRQAEMALARGRQIGTTGLVCYAAEIETAQHSHVLLAHELRAAMENDTLTMAYQPQVHLDSGRTLAVEALLRWQHPAEGSISPARFIPVAEASGLIFELGRWVARRACRDMREHLLAGRLQRVTINLSPVQLRNPGCIAGLHAIVLNEGLSPDHIEWEITESALLSGDVAINQLTEAVRLGYKIALDDFGTGYSSLSMIRSMPLHVVKIDRSFLEEVASDDHARAVLHSVAAICEQLALEMVAEGVETDAQLGVVRNAHIQSVQGYYFSQPRTVAELTPWLVEAAH